MPKRLELDRDGKTLYLTDSLSFEAYDVATGKQKFKKVWGTRSVAFGKNGMIFAVRVSDASNVTNANRITNYKNP